MKSELLLAANNFVNTFIQGMLIYPFRLAFFNIFSSLDIYDIPNNMTFLIREYAVFSNLPQILYKATPFLEQKIYEAPPLPMSPFLDNQNNK